MKNEIKIFVESTTSLKRHELKMCRFLPRKGEKIVFPEIGNTSEYYTTVKEVVWLFDKKRNNIEVVLMCDLL